MKKRIAKLLVLVTIVGGCFVGCGSTEKKVVTNPIIDGANKITNEISTEDSSVADITVEQAEKLASELVDGLETDAVEDNSNSNWTSMKFKLEGKDLQLGDSYSEFAETGWVIDYDNEYTKVSKDYKINSQESSDDYLPVENHKYEGINLYVSFYNDSDSALGLEDCKIGGIIASYDEDWSNVELDGGIKFGSLSKDILNVFGEDYHSKYEGSDGFICYTYISEDWSKEVQINLYEDTGVYDFRLTYYQ